MNKLYRIMVQGEDHSIWCEINNMPYTWCEAHGAELCDKYENAQWFIEAETSLSINDDIYEDTGEW